MLAFSAPPPHPALRETLVTSTSLWMGHQLQPSCPFSAWIGPRSGPLRPESSPMGPPGAIHHWKGGSIVQSPEPAPAPSAVAIATEEG